MSAAPSWRPARAKPLMELDLYFSHIQHSTVAGMQHPQQTSEPASLNTQSELKGCTLLHPNISIQAQPPSEVFHATRTGTEDPTSKMGHLMLHNHKQIGLSSLFGWSCVCFSSQHGTALFCHKHLGTLGSMSCQQAGMVLGLTLLMPKLTLLEMTVC